jgi:hypothetical protein
MDALARTLQQAIATISSSDPLIKLIDQVKLGRMKPSDAGLRAVTESWLATYQKVVDSVCLTKEALRRIDPAPRVAVLIHSGVLPPDHPGVKALEASFDRALTNAAE